MDFSNLCKNRSHKRVHYDAHGYMKCDIDKRYVYADGRNVTFTKPRDRKHYELKKRRLRAVFGFGSCLNGRVIDA
jgi:hypothetical protein